MQRIHLNIMINNNRSLIFSCFASAKTRSASADSSRNIINNKNYSFRTKRFWLELISRQTRDLPVQLEYLELQFSVAKRVLRNAPTQTRCNFQEVASQLSQIDTETLLLRLMSGDKRDFAEQY